MWFPAGWQWYSPAGDPAIAKRPASRSQRSALGRRLAMQELAEHPPPLVTKVPSCAGRKPPAPASWREMAQEKRRFAMTIHDTADEQALRDKAVKQLKKRRDFYAHLLVYLLVNGFLVAM